VAPHLLIRGVQLEKELQNVHGSLHQALQEVAQLVAEDGKAVLKAERRV
jgi:hypothetical protein